MAQAESTDNAKSIHYQEGMNLTHFMKCKKVSVVE